MRTSVRPPRLVGLGLSLLGLALIFCLVAVAKTAPAPSPASTPTLLFEDDFADPSLDESMWAACFWWATTTCSIETNHELQLYVKDDVLLEQNMLRLRAEHRQAKGWNGQTYRYTSGMVSTGGIASRTPPGFTFTYGYVEATVRVPAGQGFLPAVWMLPADHGSRPEIDIMEILGQEPTVTHMHYHWTAADGSPSESEASWAGPDFSTDWHTFGVDWQPDAIVWYVDDVERWRYTDTATIPAQPMYVLLDLAVGGEYPGPPDASTPFPSSFDVARVRVWDRRPAG